MAGGERFLYFCAAQGHSRTRMVTLTGASVTPAGPSLAKRLRPGSGAVAEIPPAAGGQVHPLDGRFRVVEHRQLAVAAGLFQHKAHQPAGHGQHDGGGLPRRAGQFRVAAADGQQPAVKIHQRFQVGGAPPVQPVDGQRPFVAVVVAVFGAGKLLARKQEWQAVAGQVNARRHAVLGQQVGVRGGKAGAHGHQFQLVPTGCSCRGRRHTAPPGRWPWGAKPSAPSRQASTACKMRTP